LRRLVARKIGGNPLRLLPFAIKQIKLELAARGRRRRA
jgi:hypothetical protein